MLSSLPFLLCAPLHRSYDALTLVWQWAMAQIKRLCWWGVEVRLLQQQNHWIGWC